MQEKKICRSKKVKIIYLNSSIAANDRPIISKRNCSEENLNDANHSFENDKECSSIYQSVQKHRLRNPENIVIGHLRILTGKKHRQIKLQRLQKVQIWAFGLLVQQINSS